MRGRTSRIGSEARSDVGAAAGFDPPLDPCSTDSALLPTEETGPNILSQKCDQWRMNALCMVHVNKAQKMLPEWRWLFNWNMGLEDAHGWTLSNDGLHLYCHQKKEGKAPKKVAGQKCNSVTTQKALWWCMHIWTKSNVVWPSHLLF